MRLEPREHSSIFLNLGAPVFAVLAGLAVCSIMVWLAGAPAGKALVLIFRGALGSKFAISETLTRTTPLIFCGLAAAVAFRAKLWNIGAEGQLYMGAVAATLVGTGLVDLPGYLLIPLVFAAGALAGGILLLGPALLKTKLKVDELVTTLLLNFIVLLFVNWLVFGPWKDPMALGWPQARPILDAAILGKLIPRTRLHSGLLISLAIAVIVWAFMRFTRWGLETRAVGANVRAARFSGIPVNRTIVRTALISGGLAGMAGVCELTGVRDYLTLDLSPGFGYTGIVVAMLAGLHPLGVILASFFISVIYIGADSMTRQLGITRYIADVNTAVCLLTMLTTMLLTRYRIRLK